MKKLTISLTLDDTLAERFDATKKAFSISGSELVKNTLENFLPSSTIPEDFITRCNFDLMVKQNIPIRAILPYSAAMLGYFMDGEFRLKIGSERVIINPYPEHSILCNIKIIERLYQALRTNGIL